MGEWSPWWHLQEHWPHIQVEVGPLERGVCAELLHTEVIRLSDRSSAAQQRCSLAHEIVHLERGDPPDHPVLAAREEAIVEAIAARRLIPLRALAALSAWGALDGPDHVALGVDAAMLRTRIATLQEWECEVIAAVARLTAGRDDERMTA